MIAIEVRAEEGDEIEEVLCEMRDLSKKTNCEIVIWFNNVEVYMRPTYTVEEAMERYFSELKWYIEGKRYTEGKRQPKETT